MAILSDKTLDFISNSQAQTMRLGVRLGELLQPHDLICLVGDLGAGKTALAHGIGRGWGTAKRVTSPTFTIVNEYPRILDNQILYHVDCYRLSGWAEAVTAGLEELIYEQATLMIEWPQKIANILPANNLTITLNYESETKRGLRFVAQGERATELLKTFKKQTFG